MKKSMPTAFSLNKSPSAAIVFRGGFTLLEILASIAIFSLIILVISQILATTNNTTILSNRNADSAAQARLAFDRIGIDLAALVNRTDADFQAGTYDATLSYNPFLLIFSSVGSSSSGNRTISKIAYGIKASPDNNNRLCLVRAADTILWATSDFMGNQATGYPNAISSVAPVAPVYNVLSPGVICLVVGFQLYPDTQPATLMDGKTFPNGPNALGQIVYSPPIRSSTSPGNSYVDVNRIAAMVIGVITIDLNDLNQLSAGQVMTLANQFNTATTLPINGQMPVQAWQPVLQNLSTNTSLGVPTRALKALQAYQRVYPITSYGSGN